LVQHTRPGKNTPNGRIYTYHYRPLQDPLKLTQIWIFYLKIYHLANLVNTKFNNKVIKTIKNYPNLDFLFENVPSGSPGHYEIQQQSGQDDQKLPKFGFFI
jgi:hypothetical protein